MVRGLMSDEEWACLKPFVIERDVRGGRAARGATHEYFDKWSSGNRQFRRWTLSDLWDLLLEAFNDSGGANPACK